ncbi:LLM class flavin-dependent oxidoreductase [Nocardioides sp. QY071]|uniref:LLM class flavin-dependent oxidoreductase n=1 Tax=Nocardioides sp. QY071 TaxID=3044187 RepID=UPI00249A1E00|nr:LLM class flavin-dependent oxidoreductase [Nocardioides sp. QY071]WGY00364.1 LLM class flavin-dependent oxidoreductase [Nocardioides sp. QY071]
MRFGLYFPLQLPRPWDARAEYRILDQALDQVALADELGFDHAWAPEQHFTEEYSHSSAPEVFLAAASQRTHRIRLGHGVALLPPGYNGPIRVAERTAALDLVSRGRAELGVGDSKSRLELEGFGIDPQRRQEMTEEALRLVVRMWTETPFRGTDGVHARVPTRNVLPKPLQSPHPPLWMACSDDAAIRRAARLGIGVLTHAFYDVDEAARTVELYHRTLAEECVPLSDAVNPRIAMMSPFYCHADAAEAVRVGRDAAGFLGYAVRHYYAFGRHLPGETDLWQRYEQVREGFGGAVPLRGGHAIGTPAEVRAYLEAYAEVGVDQVILAHQSGRLGHEEVCASLRLFAAEVMPAMRASRTVARQRLEALAPVVAAVRARRSALPESVAVAPEPVDAYGRSRPAPDLSALTPRARDQVADLERMAAMARALED